MEIIEIYELYKYVYHILANMVAGLKSGFILLKGILNGKVIPVMILHFLFEWHL